MAVTQASTDSRRLAAAEHFLALTDEHSSAEAVLAAVEWMDESPEHYELIRAVADFSGVCDTICEAGLVHLVAETPTRRWRWISRVVKVPVPWSLAAGMALAVIAVPLTLALRREPGAEPVFAARYSTAIGENSTVKLPDGTRLTLGGATEVRVNYGEGARRVELLGGEAFFEVAKNPDRPFSVRTSDGTVTALGTTFDVRRTDLHTTVILRTGRLRAETLQAAHGPVAYLTPDTQVSISARAGLSPVREVDAGALPTWQSGQLRFVDVALDDIVSDLRRYTPRSITIRSSSIAAQRYTGVISLEPAAIDQWLQSLSYTGDISVRTSGDRIILDDR